MIQTVVFIILILTAAIAAVYAYILKRDLAQMCRTLSQITDSETNQQLTTTTFNKEILELQAAINGILENQKKLRIKNENMNRELRRTITNISHDLRTPLTSVMGYLQMLQSEKTPDPKKAEYLAIIEPRLKALSVLMEELFEFSKITEGHLDLNMQKNNIVNLTADIISDFYNEFVDKKITPEIKLPSAPVYARCDVKAYTRILHNLIKNVLIHGSGSFGITLDAERPVIIVENSIPDTSLDTDRLFERFYTRDVSRTKKNTGLGLAIAKELAEQMDGDIMAQIHENRLMIQVSLQPFSNTL